MENQGIYGILNKVTGQYYIGSAINFYKRKAQHLKKLEGKNHHSYLLQKDWDKDLFSFLFLEYVENRNNLIEREQWWIDNSNSYYNICKIANSSLGIKRTEETKNKIRLANLGLKHPEWRNEIKSKAQGGKNHWTKNKKFSTESKKKMSKTHKDLFNSGYIHPRKGIRESKEQIQLKIERVSKPILQFDLSGCLLKEWKSSKEASESGYLAKYIINCCKNRKLTYKNFIWAYKKED